MRKASILACLLALGACPAPSTIKPPKHPASLAIKLPAAVDEDSYPRHRKIYDSLLPGAPQREAYRRVLMKYLVDKAWEESKRGSDKRAARRFAEAATLYDPAAVHRGARPAGDLVGLSHEIVRRFSPRGDEMRVLPAYCLQLSARPGDKRITARIDEILGWLDNVASLTHGESFRAMRSVQAMEATSKLWPSAFVLERLRGLYVKRSIALANASPMDRFLARRFDAEAGGGLMRAGYRIARAYLLVDRPDLALKYLRQVSVEGTEDLPVRGLLEQAVSPSANAEDHIRLAEYIEDRDPAVALRICHAASRRFGHEARVHACSGRLAAAAGQVHLAVQDYERAVELAPTTRAYAEALARQYQRQLVELVTGEQLEAAKRQLAKTERFYARAVKRFHTPLKPPLARVHYFMAHGLYNAGKIELAETALARSIAADPTHEALGQLAKILVKRGDAAGALAQLERASKLVTRNDSDRAYWGARIEALRGDALALKDDEAGGRQAHAKAARLWQVLLRRGLPPEAQAELQVNRARSLYAAGDPAGALDALDAAIDVDPTRKETYADVIALLTTHGHLPEALDALHRALGREEVSEYLKTYCSFWVIGLARRAGQEPDPLAIQHLRTLAGKAWYVRLAPLVLGEATFQQVLAHTKTLGNRTELAFYWADRLLAAGKLEEAKQMWKKVVDSKMMAFFEYDMAMYNLRSGPAKVQTRPVDRQRAGQAEEPRQEEEPQQPLDI